MTEQELRDAILALVPAVGGGKREAADLLSQLLRPPCTAVTYGDVADGLLTSLYGAVSDLLMYEVPIEVIHAEADSAWEDYLISIEVNQ